MLRLQFSKFVIRVSLKQRSLLVESAMLAILWIQRYQFCIETILKKETKRESIEICKAIFSTNKSNNLDDTVCNTVSLSVLFYHVSLFALFQIRTISYCFCKDSNLVAQWDKFVWVACYFDSAKSITLPYPWK